jgi:hypothetical protein
MWSAKGGRAFNSGRKSDAERNARPPPDGQLGFFAFQDHMKKKQKLAATTSPAAGCKGAGDGASGIELMPLSSSSSSSSSDGHGTGKHARNDGGDDYYHQTLLPPGKDGLDKAAGSGVGADAALEGMLNLITEAVQQKVTAALDNTVGHVISGATEQLKDNVTRVFDKAQQDAEARVAELKAEAKALEVRRGARTQDQLLLDSGILQLHTGKVACVVCTEHAGALTHATMLKSVWLLSNGGVSLGKRTTAAFREHKDSEMHKICAEAQSDAAAAAIPAAISKEKRRAAAVITRLMRVCCNLAKEKRSVRSYERDIALLHQCGVDMGETDHSRLTCRGMLMIIADTGRGQLKRFLCTTRC